MKALRAGSWYMIKIRSREFGVGHHLKCWQYKRRDPSHVIFDTDLGDQHIGLVDLMWIRGPIAVTKLPKAY
jgi:hypothetical protein